MESECVYVCMLHMFAYLARLSFFVILPQDMNPMQCKNEKKQQSLVTYSGQNVQRYL